MDDIARRNSLRRSIIFGVLQGVAGVAICIALMKVVPGFERMFRDFKQELPPMTRAIIAASHFTHDYWFVAIPLALLWGVANFAVVYALDSSQSAAGASYGGLADYWRCCHFLRSWLSPFLCRYRT